MRDDDEFDGLPAGKLAWHRTAGWIAGLIGAAVALVIVIGLLALALRG